MNEHFDGLNPDLVAKIRKLAAEAAETAPPLTKEQIKALAAIFRSVATKKGHAA